MTMKNIKLWIGLVALLMLCPCKRAVAQIQNRICDTIPYEFIREKIIIPVTVNGVQVKYIVDTGGRTGTMYDAAVRMKATAAGYTRVSDVNALGGSYQEGNIQNVCIGKAYRVKQLTTMVLPVSPFFTELGVVGILGGDAFDQSVLTFDSRQKVMVINYPYRPERLKVTDGLPFADSNDNHSVVKARIGDRDVNVLVDTGAGGFLMYSADDCNRDTGSPEVEVTNHGYGIVAAGLTGLGHPVDIKKVNVSSIDLMGKVFTNVGSTTTVMNGTIIGVDVLKYGRVVIDYMRKRFYFLPFDKGPTDMGGAPKLWNVSILPRNGRFEITTVWDSMKGKVAFGDQVTNINGTSLKDCPMSQMAVEDIMDAISGDTAYILVKNGNKEQRIEIKREQ